MKHLLTFAALLLVLAVQKPASLLAQSPSYFPDVVIVKFESETQQSIARAKTGIDPQQQVRNFMAPHGLSQITPLINPSAQKRLKIQAGINSGSPHSDLGRIYQINYTGGADPARLAAKIANMPGVEYAEPKYIRYLQLIPNDPIENPYLNYHNFDQAWDITTGSRDVVVAIVDGGVGYTHPELNGKMWINEDEIPAGIQGEVDVDGDGTITSGEVLQYLQDNNEDYNSDGSITLEDALHPTSPLTTGSDTDGNGFPDDLYGWNFWASGGLNGNQTDADNNPIHDATAHGTHVAGIAAAETDNGEGIYATGYDVRYMAIKAGGTPSEPTAIGFGFEGILYAVEAQADIINCSWGGPGRSQAEEDIIDFAVSMGSLVIAAAGNESSDQVIYPAAFNHVLSVGSVETNDRVASYSNFGYSLDVLATGTAIQSTVFDGAIEPSSGTSMATPVVSGLAGLIKSLHPDWSPLRIANQIRATSQPVDNGNPQRYTYLLGKGRVDAFAAVQPGNEKPGIMVEAVEFVNQNGEKLILGEPGTISVTLVNYGAPARNIELDILALEQEGLSLGEATPQVGSLGTDDSVTISFSLTIQEDYNLDDIPTFLLDIRDNETEYSDFSILRYQNLLFDIVDVNDVITSFAADGSIGFTDFNDPQTGVGFIPREPEGSGDNLLFEGGLMMLANEAIYDAVRGTGNQLSRDFDPEQVFRTITPGEVSDQDGYARFSVSDSAAATFATIELETYAYDRPDIGNVVYLKYTITNPSEFVQLKDLYLGLFNDWDIGTNTAANGSAFNSQDSILYLFDETDNSEQPLVAAAHLGPVTTALGIDNASQTDPSDSLSFGLYDDFTNEEKKLALQAGIANTDISNADVSAVVASGPYTVNPQASVVVGFVYAFGEDLEALRRQIQNARAQAPFETSATGVSLSEEVPPTTRLFQNYPNPFSETTTFRVDLQEDTHVELVMYDVLGREVSVLIDQQLEARTHILRFTNRRLSSGIYFIRLKTDEEMQTIPITLIR